MDDRNKSKHVKAFFEADEIPWEDFYHRDRVEANMYWSRSRASLAYAKRYLPSNAQVLEIGSGPGHLSMELVNAGFDVVSCDIALRMAEQTRGRTGSDTVIVADSGALPFAESSFDAIVMIGVISYLPDPVPVLDRIRRLLKPGGLLLISSANTNLLFSAVNRRVGDALVKMRLRKRQTRAPGSFYANECTYYKATDFNRLVSGLGYSYLDNTNVGFGRVRILDTNILPATIDVALANALSKLSNTPGFRGLGDYAFANIACFRTAPDPADTR